MKKTLSRLLITAAIMQLVVLSQNCTYDEKVSPPQSACLPAANISFATDVQPILLNSKAFIADARDSWGKAEIRFGLNLSRVFTLAKHRS